MNISDSRVEGDLLAIELYTHLQAIPAALQKHALYQVLRDEGRAALHTDTSVNRTFATERVLIPIIAVN